MALNEHIVDADSLSFEWSADPSIDSGDFVVIGGLRGVAETTASEKPNGRGVYSATVKLKGVFIGTSADAFTAGQAVYLDAAATSGTALTNDPDGVNNKLVGYAYYAKSGGAGKVYVRVNN